MVDEFKYNKNEIFSIFQRILVDRDETVRGKIYSFYARLQA